jgi:choline dehydrogenase
MERWDYVVAGGGSAGCVVAGRLAAAGARVLLVEHGQRAEENPETLRADGYREAFINDEVIWERFSEPQTALGGRRLFMGSGRGLGGSGAVNAMVYTRGDARDYEAWGDGWRWDDVVDHFAALEQTLVINQRPPTSFTDTCIRAAEQVGFRHSRDLNDGNIGGVLGYEWMSFAGEDRRSAYVAFVRPEEASGRLTIATGATARRVIVESGRAVGLEMMRDGRLERAFADREVIVCAGALESPKLLMISGIGPAAQLRALGMPIVADLPVGENLHDHPNVSLFFFGRQTVDSHYPQLYGFHRVGEGRDLAPGQSDTCYVFYPARSSFREGLMRMVPTMMLPPSLYGARDKLLPRLLQRSIAGAFDRRAVQRFIARLYGIVVILGKPESRGTLRLASADPDAPAKIDPAYLADPADMETMVRGVALARAIAAATPLSGWGNRELIPGPTGRSRAAIERFIRSNVMTTYHYAGTCRLGEVVDRRLSVHGVRGLRVADASVIPVTPVAALNAPSMLIGHRAATFALEDR